jgi:hypothetical protein
MPKPADRRNYTTATPPPRYVEATLSWPEWGLVQRVRQLKKRGADMVVIEIKGNEPKVRTVGKREG